MKTILISSILALSLVPTLGFCGNEGPRPGPGPRPPTNPAQTPILQCFPPDGTLFGFSISKVTGCELTPGGPVCGNRYEMEVFGIDPRTQQWSYGGSIEGFRNAEVQHETPDSFSFHSADLSGQVDIEVQGATTRVNIGLNGGFYLTPRLDTGGTQTVYECQFM